MQKNLEGKTALVTGSTSGIGAGIAKKLAAAGANIAVTGLEDDQNITQQLIDTYNIKAYFFQADLSKSQPCAELVQNAANKMNSVDILVNNAGAQYVSPVEDFADEKWDLLIALNLSASFHLIKSSLPYMRKGDYGRIINIASAHGLVASPQKAAYVAAKHGLVGLTKVVGLETAQENITVNAICPGWVLTPLVQKQIDAIAANHNIDNIAASEKLLSEKQPSLQFATPEQIGAYAAFLCSDDAAQITASIQSIDGGWTAR